jgi:osmotically-inducible protein OsmY
MTVGTLTQEDRKLRDAVGREIERDPNVDASAIGITARDHVVTLTGFVDSCAAKLAAERAARRVHGVKGVANDIQVRNQLSRTDAEIAADAVRALELHGAMPDGVQVVVHNERVTLTGCVRRSTDRVAATRALRHLRGAKSVVNRLEVVPGAWAEEVSGQVARALPPSGHSGTHGIEVTVAESIRGSRGNRRHAPPHAPRASRRS